MRLAAAETLMLSTISCTRAYGLCLGHQQLQLPRLRPVRRSHSGICIVCSCDMDRSHGLQLLLLPCQRGRLALGLGSQPRCCAGCQHLLLHCLRMQPKHVSTRTHSSDLKCGGTSRQSSVLWVGSRVSLRSRCGGSPGTSFEYTTACVKADVIKNTITKTVDDR